MAAVSSSKLTIMEPRERRFMEEDKAGSCWGDAGRGEEEAAGRGERAEAEEDEDELASEEVGSTATGVRTGARRPGKPAQRLGA